MKMRAIHSLYGIVNPHYLAAFVKHKEIPCAKLIEKLKIQNVNPTFAHCSSYIPAFGSDLQRAGVQL